MSVHRYDSDRGTRITVRLGSEEIVLDVAAATQLRDDLTRELGAPQTLTAGEMAVWAAVYAAAWRREAADENLTDREVATIAAQEAGMHIRGMREAGYEVEAHRDGYDLTGIERPMLAAMTGGGK